MHELSEFLSRRYPKVYSVTRHDPDQPETQKQKGWYGEGRIKEITILPLGVTYNLDEEEPMKVAALLYVPVLFRLVCCPSRRTLDVATLMAKP